MDNQKIIAPLSRKRNALRRALRRCYGYFAAKAQNFLKSGINKKNNTKNDPIVVTLPATLPTTLELIPHTYLTYCLNNYADELLRQTVLQIELTRRYGTSPTNHHQNDNGTLNENRRRTH